MDRLNAAIAVIAAATLVFGLLTGFVKGRLYCSEPLLAVLLGALAGPHGLGLVHLGTASTAAHLLEEGARFTVTVSVMGVALRLAPAYMTRHRRSLAVILGPGMLLMGLISGMAAYLLLDLSFWKAMLLGAVVTPTDPVLAGAIVTGKVAERAIPERIRHFVSAESGANDGLAFPLVMLCLLMATGPSGHTTAEWLAERVVLGVAGALTMGAVAGIAAGRLLRWADRHDLSGETSLLTTSLSLAFMTMAVTQLFGGADVLAAFTAGLFFDRVIRDGNAKAQERIQEAMRYFLEIPIFFLFGAALPFAAWFRLGNAALLLAGVILVFRRLPMIFLLGRWLDPFVNRSDRTFAGWFGPIGVAAMYYALMVAREAHLTVIWSVGSLVIFASVCVHGVTATPLTRLFGTKVYGHNTA